MRRRADPVFSFSKGHVVNKSLCLALAACLGLAACSTERLARFPSYKLTIVQGNELDLQAVAALRQDLSKEQVQHLLGTPLLRDPMHAERWDYLFEVSRGGKVSERKNLTLYFDQNDSLVRAEGDVLNELRQQQQPQ
nr:outer membrane protein assembly factor BamE [Eikenella glucosivorans]